MARQTGIIKLKGTIGGISFYKSSDGHMAREKGGIDATRMATDPAFARTRENGVEFATAGRAAKLLRDTLKKGMQFNADARHASRLTKAMMEVLKADTASPRGQRKILDAGLGSLEGYEFNLKAPLNSIILANYIVTTDSATRTAVVDYGQMSALKNFRYPKGATAMRFYMSCSTVNFDTGDTFHDMNWSGYFPIDPSGNEQISMNTLMPAGNAPLFIAYGVNFYQKIEGKYYAFKNGGYNSLKLIKVLVPEP